jgi:DNA-binding winged helix-turn-helix (wHTH) protein/Tol biopolymer transport system component
MSLEAKQLYEFKNFRLDTGERVLTRDGKPLPITPKVFQLLKILIERHGHVVEKNELMKEIWADSFVEDGNLTFNIRMLRKALGDNAASPEFIETVPRRGYRFIAEVRKVSDEEEKSFPPQAVLADAEPSVSARKSYLSFALIIAALAGSLFLGLWLTQTNVSGFDSSAVPILSAPFRSEKISNSGKVRLAVISPDGKLVAYTDETNGRYGVWLRRVETSENIQLIPPSEDIYHGLIFAPDGQSLFFVRKPLDDNSPSAIYRISIFGVVPEKILEGVEGWISISPDNRQISFVRCPKTDDEFCSLCVADADGSNERKLVMRPRPFRIGDNQFSPDGKSIAFAAGQSWNGGSDFRLLKFDFKTGAETEISPKAFFNIKNLDWLPGGNGLFLTATENLAGKLKIWRVSIADGEAAPLTQDATDYSTISLNKNADKMIATQVSSNFRLHLVINGETKVLTGASGMTFAPGGKIVYSSNGGDIWTINLDGSQQRQLTNNSASDFFPQVSPDGRFIYFTSNRTGANQVWRMNADGSDQRQLTQREGGYPVFVTPDGKWVYYTSGLRGTLWRVLSGGGEEAQFSEQKMYSSRFTPDGSFIAYFYRENGWKIGVMSVADGKIVKTINYADGKSPAASLAWGADNRTLYFVARSKTNNSLWRQSLDDNAPYFVAVLGEGEVSNFELAPDVNEAFAYIRGEWLHDAVFIDGLK